MGLDNCIRMVGHTATQLQGVSLLNLDGERWNEPGRVHHGGRVGTVLCVSPRRCRHPLSTFVVRIGTTRA